MMVGLGGDGASVRADEILALMYDDASGARLVRDDLFVLHGDRLVSPLLSAASVSVGERAAV
jgi:hypothetical protein